MDGKKFRGRSVGPAVTTPPDPHRDTGHAGRPEPPRNDDMARQRAEIRCDIGLGSGHVSYSPALVQISG